MCRIESYGLTKVNQKDFNNCRNRLYNEAICLYNLSDRKSQLILKDWISEKLNELIAKLKGKIRLNEISLEMIDVKW